MAQELWLSAFSEQRTDWLWDLQEEARASFLYDASLVQDSVRFRLKKRAVWIAKAVISSTGQLEKDKIESILNRLKKQGHITYLGGYGDGPGLEHMMAVLERFLTDEALGKFLQRFHPPLCHAFAEDLIRDSLGAFKENSLSSASIQRAVLSACLCPLRQNVGSCFATAPAILIQKERLDLLLQDLYDLLMTGKMKRTFGGSEFSVPLSPTSGGGDLYKHIQKKEALLSPSLKIGFEAIGVDENTSKELLSLVFESKTSLPVIQLIHEALLRHFGLKEEDLESHKEAMRSFFKSKEFMEGIQRAPLSKKRQLAEELLLKEKKVQEAFKACIDHPLLKAWEFSIASFSDVKTEFSSWNLYASLGLHHEEEGGIGQILYAVLQKDLEEENRKVEEYNQEYQIAENQLRATEALLKSASTESDIRRLKAEFASRLYHMRTCLELRDAHYTNSSQCSLFFSFLLQEYEKRFPEYFQEIYDAKMQDLEAELYEDSPAGFRLMYKHGRSNPSAWTMIYTAEEYIDSLVDFFLKIEPQVSGASSWKEAAKINERLTTLIVSHLRTELFLKTAISRIEKAHQRVLSLEEKRKRMPWAYTSGGNMSMLLKIYYRKEAEVFEEKKCVKSALELLVFLLDVLKTMPLSYTELYEVQKKGMLVSSPSHAFILYPSWPLFKEGWHADLFTYTWVRDFVLKKGQSFYEAIRLSLSEQSFLIDELGKQLPSRLASSLKTVLLAQESSIGSFKEQLMKVLSYAPGATDKMDSFLYEMLPLQSAENVKSCVLKILDDLDKEKVYEILDQIPEMSSEWIGAIQLKELAKTIYLRSEKTLGLSFDLHEKIGARASFLGLSAPRPLLFADTNWPHYHFGFVVNPSSQQLELWRFDPTGSTGIPMRGWRKYLTEENVDSWAVYRE
jgi:hypothetical protein